MPSHLLDHLNAVWLVALFLCLGLAPGTLMTSALRVPRYFWTPLVLGCASLIGYAIFWAYFFFPVNARLLSSAVPDPRGGVVRDRADVRASPRDPARSRRLAADRAVGDPDGRLSGLRALGRRDLHRPLHAAASARRQHLPAVFRQSPVQRALHAVADAAAVHDDAAGGAEQRSAAAAGRRRAGGARARARLGTGDGDVVELRRAHRRLSARMDSRALRARPRAALQPPAIHLRVRRRARARASS